MQAQIEIQIGENARFCSTAPSPSPFHFCPAGRHHRIIAPPSSPSSSLLHASSLLRSLTCSPCRRLDFCCIVYSQSSRCCRAGIGEVDHSALGSLLLSDPLLYNAVMSPPNRFFRVRAGSGAVATAAAVSSLLVTRSLNSCFNPRPRRI